MNEPLIVTIREYGPRAHQAGRGPGNDGPSNYMRPISEGQEIDIAPVVVHVRDGKPVTALGRKLMGL